MKLIVSTNSKDYIILDSYQQLICNVDMSQYMHVREPMRYSHLGYAWQKKAPAEVSGRRALLTGHGSLPYPGGEFISVT